MWSAWQCVATTRWRWRTPRRRSQRSTDSPGGPPSISHRRPSACSIRAASPWPTSRKVTWGATGWARSPSTRATAGSSRQGRRGTRSRAASNAAPAGPTAGVSGGTARKARIASRLSTAVLPSAPAGSAREGGPQVATAAAGATTKVTTGMATRFATGARGATSWNHHAAAGSVPSIAATVVARPPHTARTGHHHRRAGRASFARQRISPATAPNDSWNEAVPMADGSANSTARAARASVGRAGAVRPVARAVATRATSTAARWALTGAPTDHAQTPAAAAPNSHAAPCGMPTGRSTATARRSRSPAPVMAPATAPTCSPLIASRWAVPVRRSRASASGSTRLRSPRASARSSPVRSPRTGWPDRSPPTMAALCATRRVATRPRRAATTGSGAPGSTPRSIGPARPVTSTGVPGGGGRSRNRTRTRPVDGSQRVPGRARRATATSASLPEVAPATTPSSVTHPRTTGPGAWVPTSSQPKARPRSADGGGPGRAIARAAASAPTVAATAGAGNHHADAATPTPQPTATTTQACIRPPNMAGSRSRAGDSSAVYRWMCACDGCR
ncbi:MAG: hypothetical protein ACI8PZ_000096 [Myxococcota bacterium]|jgi:hypothetical protein